MYNSTLVHKIHKCLFWRNQEFFDELLADKEPKKVGVYFDLSQEALWY